MTSTSPALPAQPLRRVAKRVNLREKVTEQLRSSILTGAMPAGEVYSAPALAHTFGVSATPVREAMLDLVKDGLVESVPNKGFRVVEVSEKDLDDLAQVRTFLEPAATRAAAEKIASDDLPPLRELAEEIARAAEARDLPRYLEADRQFHAAVLSFTGNQRLVEFCSALRAQTRTHGISRLIDRGELASSINEHRVLLQLIETRDLDGVEDLMRRHIGHTRGLWAGAEESR